MDRPSKTIFRIAVFSVVLTTAVAEHEEYYDQSEEDYTLLWDGLEALNAQDEDLVDIATEVPSTTLYEI